MNFYILFTFIAMSFYLPSCKDNPSDESTPDGFSCQCEKNGVMQTLNASSVKEAQNNCDTEGGKLKMCAKK